MRASSILLCLLLTGKVFAQESAGSGDPGWAMGAGTYGYVAAPIVLALAIGSEITKGDDLPALPLGGSAILISTISVPIIAAGGSTARTPERIKGSRLPAWVAYGGGLVSSTFLFVTGILGYTPTTPLITCNGLILSCSIILMAKDARLRGKTALKGKTADNNGTLDLRMVPIRNGGKLSLNYNF